MSPEGAGARRIFVRGRVQGVAFRASARAEAARLGLGGWVRNRLDGRVEILAQGDAAALDALEHWCHRGPPAARVDEVHAEDLEPDSGIRGFEIAPSARE
jgi:acylphosphatase